MKHAAQLLPDRAGVERNHLLRQYLHARQIGATRLPGKMEWTHNNTRGIGMQPQFVLDQLNHKSPPSFGFMPFLFGLLTLKRAGACL